MLLCKGVLRVQWPGDHIVLTCRLHPHLSPWSSPGPSTRLSAALPSINYTSAIRLQLGPFKKTYFDSFSSYALKERHAVFYGQAQQRCRVVPVQVNHIKTGLALISTCQRACHLSLIFQPRVWIWGLGCDCKAQLRICRCAYTHIKSVIRYTSTDRRYQTVVEGHGGASR